MRRTGAPVDSGAIHRSVLAGFPCQIGRLGEERLYEGPRGLRFFISPGSSLFRHEAPWVVAAELMETTRLFARTAGRIRSDWVERVAPHLVKREHFEPHWRRDSGQVAAYERVTLHGLVLVPRRRVPYGPIDPAAARDIFIQSALVDEQIRSDGEFLAANRELIETLELLEAKKRQRDILADTTARFEFYNARVPAEIHSTPSFEKWRREAERRTPRVLFMARSDLLRPGVDALAPEAFPDTMELDGLLIPLEYRHEPGEQDDGVTATVPLAGLRRLDARGIEWLVPGMLAEKVVALLRTLPKRLRVRFVPAGDYAAGAVEALAFGEGALLERLAEYLRRLTGTPVAESDFQPGELPKHLRMHVRVLDEQGAEVARGRDLAAMQRELASRGGGGLVAVDRARSTSDGARRTTSTRMTGPEASSHGSSTRGSNTAQPMAEVPSAPARMTAFEVDEIPEVVEAIQGGMSVPAHPAMVDLGDAVALRLFASAHDAADAHRGGVRRLATIALGAELRPLLEYLPGPDGSLGIAGLRLLAAPCEPGDAFEAALIERIAERATMGAEGAPRSAAAFGAAVARGEARLWEVAREVVDLAWSILRIRQELAAALDAPLPSTWEAAARELRDELRTLLPPRFLVELPWERLVHLPRLLAAKQSRLARLRAHGHARDQRLAAEVAPFWARWIERRDALAGRGRPMPELDRFRWLIEEFRVSLFAPQLRTAVPVSAVRLERQWAEVERL